MRVKEEKIKQSQIFPCIQYIWVKNSGGGSILMIYIYSAEQTIRINPQISRIPNKRESQGSEEIIYPVIGRFMFGCCAYLTYRPAFICLELAHIMKFPPPFFHKKP